MGHHGHSTTTTTTDIQKGISVAPSMSGSSSVTAGDLITGDNNKLQLVNLMALNGVNPQMNNVGGLVPGCTFFGNDSNGIPMYIC